MLRSLLLKKLLAYGNVVLAVLLVLFVVVQMLRLPSESVEAREQVEVAPSMSSIQIASVAKRGEYDAIIASEILGPDVAPAAAKPPRVKKVDKTPKEEVVTTLPLRLIGTVVAQDDDPSGSAIIENKSGIAVKKTYFVGDEVMDEVFLQTVRRRMVVLDNRKANRLEQLLLEEGMQKFTAVSGSSGVRSREDILADRTDLASRIREARPAVAGANRIFTFDRQQLIAEIEAQYDQLASNVDVQIVTDANGNVQGVQASNIGNSPFAQKFGIEEGDVIQSVNGQQVDSLDRVYDIIDTSQSASTFRVQLLRGGRPQVFTYHLR